MALLPPTVDGWHRGLVVAARYASELWVVKTDEPGQLIAQTAEYLSGGGEHCQPCGRAVDDMCNPGLACVDLYRSGEPGRGVNHRSAWHHVRPLSTALCPGRLPKWAMRPSFGALLSV